MNTSVTRLESLVANLRAKFQSKDWAFDCSQMSQEELSGAVRQVCAVFADVDNLRKVAHLTWHPQNALTIKWFEISEDEKLQFQAAIKQNSSDWAVTAG